MQRSVCTRGRWSRGQGLVRSGLGLMVLALACVAGAQDPPPPGGGGGGTDYPRITNITASGSSATVEYYLDKLYTGGLDENVRLQVYYDGFEIENRVISGSPGTYTANLNLGRPNGYFYVRLTLEVVDDPISGQWEKGIGRAFRVKDGSIFSLFLQAAWVGNEGVYTWPVRAKCPPGGCGGGASQGASVASCPIPDVQHSIDFPLDGGQGGSIPCVSCRGGGGGTGDNAYGPTFSIRLMAQYSPFVSSLSPGYFTPYDSQAFVFYNAVDQVTVVRVVDVEQADILTFRDGVEDSDLAPPLQLLDANGGVTTSIEFAVKVVMTRYDGSRLEFTLYDVLDNDQTLDKDGRLTKLITPQGHATTLGYSTSNPGQLASVTGPSGQTLTFTYGSQISGRETLSSVTLPDGNTLQFTYVLGHLTQAAIGTSWSATYGIVEDEEAQTANFSIQDGRGGSFTTLFTQSFIELHGSLLDQPESIVRGVMNAAGETISGVFFDPQDSTRYLVWRGTDYLSHVDIGVGECFMTSFTVGDPGLGYGAFTYATEAGYPLNIFMSGYTPNEFITGAPVQTLDGAGHTTSYVYDEDHFKTQASYGDGSSETWGYNTRHQVTRHQDRLGRVTNYVYDTAGNLLEKQTGILRVNGVDVTQAEYGVWKYEYNTRGQLTKEKDPLFNPAQPDLHVTEYNYDANTWLLTSKVEAAATAGGSRPTTSYTYNAQRRLATLTDPSGHVTTFSYDGLGRVVQTLYHDGTTDQSVFGAFGSGQERLVLKRKDRNNGVTTFTYDTVGRVTQKLVGAARDSNIRDGQPDQEPITDPNQQQLTTYQYQPGTSQIREQVVDGERTTYEFDYRMRTVKTKRYPRSGATLESLTQYFQNQVFYTQDAYGRREYMGYRASDGELIRRVQTTHPSYTLANNTAIMNLTRSTTPNAAYVIADAIKNAAGELTQVIDGRGTSTTYDYDSRGQQIRQRAAQGTAFEAVTEWTYDGAGNTLEVRTPRYFDATDPAYQQAKSTTTYNGRNQVVTSTEAPGTPVAATTQTSYYADGRVDTTTDARGNAWKSVWYSCCGNSVGQRDPAGHGSLTNSDPMGHAAHTAVVQDFDTHTNVQDPLDAKTLAESTTKFDVLGRPVASTQWLTARGLVDPQSVPLAGLYAADKTEGLTTQTLYDRNLADGVGLDSATGMTVSKLGGGTYNVSLAAVLAKLASTPANGGASVTFASGSDGSATVSISPQEELTVSVQDGLGRTVCTAQIQSYSGSSPNALVSWQCTQYDSVVSLSGFGNVLETVHIDAANGQTKSRSDGAGRTLQTLDALGQVTTLKVDAGGAVVERRDANNVGYNAVFDALGRETSRTDTQGAVVQTSYNRAGDVMTVTDAKNQVTTSVYDARGRLVSRTNRLSGGTAWTYDVNGNLLTLTDAENQTTAYVYDSRNLKIQETYPDHVAGATVGTAGYGIVAYTYDPARRVQRKTDQLGDTVTYQFDLAGRLTRRDYRTRVNSPSGTIADSDLFTFDLASRLLTAVSGRYANTVTQTYDGVGRLKTESLTVAGQTYPVTRDYDVLGRLSRLTYPDGSLVDRTYTARSQLYQVKHNNSLLETRAYDNGGRWTSQTYGNGVVTTRTYRNDNLTTLIDVRDGSNAQLDSFAYTYDANQNKTAETRTGVMAPWGWSTGTSGYDAEDRLRAWNRTDGQLTQGWNLTLEGDWQQFTQNGTPQNRTHGPAHELTAVGGTGLTHDVKGNLTQAATGHRYTWDFDNQLQGVDTSGDQVADVTFGYDALGRRVKKTASGATKVYVSATQPIAYSPQAGQELVEYVSGAAPTSPSEKYVYGDYIDEPLWKTGTGGAVYFHANSLYCVSALTNGSGAVVERYRYTPYGELTILAADGVTVRSASAYANPYTYTGRRWDSETGLYYYRARYYHPTLGRFLARDPIFRLRQGTYQALVSNPLSWTDPSGHALGMGARLSTHQYTGDESDGLWDPGLSPSPGGCRISVECVRRPSWAPAHCGLHIQYWQNGALVDRRYHAWGIFSAPGVGGCEMVSGRPPSTRPGDSWSESDSYDWPLSKCLCIENAIISLNNGMRGGADNYQIIPRNACCGKPGCNSNYSAKCVLRSCGLSVAWSRAPWGWNHRMEKCVDVVWGGGGAVGGPPGYGCYCRQWQTIDTAWCGF